MSQGLTDAIVDLRMDEAVTLAQRMLAGGTDPLAIIAEGSEAMEVIGRRFADGEAFIPELIMGGEIMKSISEEVMPEGGGPDAESSKGTVVIGTVHGDIHDIGKDIVALMLRIERLRRARSRHGCAGRGLRRRHQGARRRHRRR